MRISQFAISSNLCHITPPIKFLSNSLPYLNTILWVKPDMTYQDEAEEALNVQYDRQIEEFFLLEMERVRYQRKASASDQILPLNLLKHEGYIILNPTDSEEEAGLNTTSEEDFA